MIEHVTLAVSILLNVVLFMLALAAGKLRKWAENERDAYKLVNATLGRKLEQKLGQKKATRIGGAVTLAIEQLAIQKARGDNPNAKQQA